MATEDRKVAIVTGASQGIGKSIAKCLLYHDYKVYIFDIDSEFGTKTEQELNNCVGNGRVSFLKCDVTNEEQFQGAFNEVTTRCNCISLLVNNAGIADEYNPDKCIAVNLSAMIRGSNLAVEHMRRDKGGKGGTIINISSMTALQPSHILPTYSATKSGILSFTKAWAKNPSLKEYGLKFMCLCPGFVKTSLTESGASKTLDPAIFEAAKIKIGLLSLDTVQTAFDKLLTEGTNGSVLEVSTFKTEFLTDPVIMQPK